MLVWNANFYLIRGGSELQIGQTLTLMLVPYKCEQHIDLMSITKLQNPLVKKLKLNDHAQSQLGVKLGL